jgi:hypothetical protein
VTSVVDKADPGPAFYLNRDQDPGAESKVKHGVSMPEYATTESTPTDLPWATLCQSRIYPLVRVFGFGLRILMTRIYKKFQKLLFIYL